MEVPKNSNEGPQHENFGKVAYIFGVIQKDLNEEVQKDWTWDEICIQCENIVIAWEGKPLGTFKTEEEEGYIMAFAERVFREKFGE